MWTDARSQYQSPYKPDQVAAEVVAHAQAGSIIYLHDGKKSEAEVFVASVEQIIDQLEAKGYQFVRLDEIPSP